MNDFNEPLKEISSRLGPYSEDNLAMVKGMHEKFEAMLLVIAKGNEQLAKPYRTASYDIGKWISSALDPKTSPKMKKAWYDMAVSGMKTQISGLQGLLNTDEEQKP